MFGGSSKPHCANQPISLKFKRSSLSPFSFLFFPPFPDPSPLNLQYPIPHLSFNFNTFSFTILTIPPKHLLLPSRIPPPLTFNSSSKSGAKQSAYPPCILCTQRKKINAAQRGPQGALPQERSEARTPVLEE